MWTDLTGRARLAGGGEISITRGASDELAETQTGTMSLELDNQDGVLTPGNAGSPYWPEVRRGTPVRVIATALAGKNYLTQPGFEADDGSWSAVAGAAPASAGPDTGRAKSGPCSYRIGWAAAGTGGVVQCPLYGLTIGVPYTASVYVWVPAGSPAVRLDVDGLAVGPASTLTGAWQRVSVTWTTSSAAHVLRVTTTTASPAPGATVWLDEAQVEEGPVATTWSSSAATHHPRFFGVVTSWPVVWAGLHSTVRLTASDMLSWPGRRGALGPMLVEEVLGDEARLYYPLSEPESSTSGGDQSGYGRPSMTIRQSGTGGGTLDFGKGVGPPSDELPAPLFVPTSASAGLYLQTRIAPLLTSSGATGTPVLGDQVFECWFNTGTPGRTIMSWSSGAPGALDSALRFQLDGTGRLQIAEVLPTGTSTYTVAAPSLADGRPHHLVWDEAGQAVWVDAVQYPVATGTWADRAVLTVGATETGGSLWVGTISHVAAYVRTGGYPAIAEMTDHYQAGMTGHAGEPAWIRMYRLAGYARIPGVIPRGVFSAVSAQGTLGAAPLSHMREIERTEGGRLFADRAGPQLVFQSRTVRYNPTATASVPYASLETGDVVVAVDDQKQTNLVTASRPGGATQRVQDPASIRRDGIYEDQLDILKVTDAEVTDAATWVVNRYSVPQPELRQVPVEAATLGAATYRALLDADISTVIRVPGMPAQAPAPSATVIVEGYTERITAAQHFLDFHTSRADTDSVWVLDDPSYSVLGSTTRLAY
ncbi:hypothetical protein BU197_02900 [Streptomyces sp. CBMA291]|nr:hypothetical protein [Streptomyces sp. CBMA291]MBD0715150.1 hypothetical protein [Streptomyces sp. CBMA370]